MQAGLYYGYAALVDGVISRIQKEQGDTRVIATGGLARLIAQEAGSIEAVDENLTLDGLRLIYQLNRP